MKTAEPQYREAWDQLQRFEISLLSTTATTTRVPDEELDTTRAQLEAARQQVHKFIKDTKTYRRCERAVRRHELRAQWVLEQLSLIDSSSFYEKQNARGPLECEQQQEEEGKRRP